MLRFISVFEPCDHFLRIVEAQRVRWGRRASVMELRVLLTQLAACGPDRIAAASPPEAPPTPEGVSSSFGGGGGSTIFFAALHGHRFGEDF